MKKNVLFTGLMLILFIPSFCQVVAVNDTVYLTGKIPDTIDVSAKDILPAGDSLRFYIFTGNE